MKLNDFTKINFNKNEVDKVMFNNQLVWFKGTKCTDCITFESEDASTFSLRIYNNQKPWNGTIEYSKNAITWKEWNGTTINSNAKGQLYLRGTNNTSLTNTTLDNAAMAQKYTFDGAATRIKCKGNIETLLDYQTVANKQHPTMDNYCFFYLFYDCSKLTQAPELPATNLSKYCYRSMFRNCTSLKLPPVLPATVLKEGCYYSMFLGCEELISIPELTATTLADYCYFCMFKNCTSIYAASLLQAQELKTQCYGSMFYGCTSLERVMQLPITSIQKESCSYMFLGCHNISIATTASEDNKYGFRIPMRGTISGVESIENPLIGMFSNLTPEFSTTYYVNKRPLGEIILEPPTLSLEGSVLTLTAPLDNEYIAGFKVYNGNTLISTLTNTTTLDLSTILTEAGTYTITAKSYGTKAVDSVSSETKTYTVI